MQKHSITCKVWAIPSSLHIIINSYTEGGIFKGCPLGMTFRGVGGDVFIFQAMVLNLYYQGQQLLQVLVLVPVKSAKF